MKESLFSRDEMTRISLKASKTTNENKNNESLRTLTLKVTAAQVRNQDFMWGGANEAKVDQTTEMFFFYLIFF